MNKPVSAFGNGLSAGVLRECLNLTNCTINSKPREVAAELNPVVNVPGSFGTLLKTSTGPDGRFFFSVQTKRTVEHHAFTIPQLFQFAYEMAPAT